MLRSALFGASALALLSSGCTMKAPPRFFRVEHRRVHEVTPVKSDSAPAQSAATSVPKSGSAELMYAADALRNGEILCTKADEYRAFVITYEKGASDYRFSFLLLGPETTVQVGVDGADLYLMSGFIYIRGHWGRVRGERVFAGTTGSTLMMQVDKTAGQSIDRVFFEAGTSAGIERISDGYRETWTDKTKYREITDIGIQTKVKPPASDPLGAQLSTMRQAASEFEID